MTLMPTNKMMEEVWRWKEEVARHIEGMTVEQRIAYYRTGLQRFEEKVGKKIELRRLKRNKPEYM
jgi:hypothetical protein